VREVRAPPIARHRRHERVAGAAEDERDAVGVERAQRRADDPLEHRLHVGRPAERLGRLEEQREAGAR
jgi:hypothetical protein